MAKDQYIAPNGGWGWAIVVGFALNNIVIVPVLQGFGMVYGSSFKRLEISATESSIIININQAFGMILGLMNGPLLRKFGYRKIAIAGSLLFSSGVILTSFATNFIHFVISYGMMTCTSALGMSIGMSSFSLAINTYFKEKRGRAVGLSMTITGLGPIFMPHLASLLLSIYDSEGTMLILGAISFHSLIGAFLLHPIKWHAISVETKQETPEAEQDEQENESVKNNITQDSVSLLGASNEKSLNGVTGTNNDIKKCIRKRSRTTTTSSANFDDDNASVYGFELPISMHNASISDLRAGSAENGTSLNLKNEENTTLQKQLSASNFKFDYKRSSSFNETKSRRFSVSSKVGDDVALSKKMFTECPEEDEDIYKNLNDSNVENDTYKKLDKLPETEVLTSTEKPKQEKKRSLRRSLHGIANFFDLGLLRDPIYVNIMLGMSVAIFAEFNFSVLTPFILSDMHLMTDQIATTMSIIGLFDLVLRAVAPYIGEWLRKSPRVMYFVSLILLIVSRSGLLFTKSYASIQAVGVALGIAKGIRTVYMSLVIPNHVPLERLASASSIQSMVNGCLMLSAGPFLGIMRDFTGSYRYSIVFINFVTSITLIMWMVEFIIKFIKKHRKPRIAMKLEQGEKS